MTFFDSKRYFAAKRFSEFYTIRKFFLSTAAEQEQKYKELFCQQSIRYSCQIKGNHFEERFEGMDGKGLFFRHPLVEKETYSDYLTELLHYYGFAFGAVLRVPSEENLEDIVQRSLLNDLHFTYEQDTIVYRKDDTEFYITLTEFKNQNFALRVFEKSDYDSTYKEDLLRAIHLLLAPLLAH